MGGARNEASGPAGPARRHGGGEEGKGREGKGGRRRGEPPGLGREMVAGPGAGLRGRSAACPRGRCSQGGPGCKGGTRCRVGRDGAAAEQPSGGSDTAACEERAWEGSSGRADVGGAVRDSPSSVPGGSGAGSPGWVFGTGGLIRLKNSPGTCGGVKRAQLGQGHGEVALGVKEGPWWAKGSRASPVSL